VWKYSSTHSLTLALDGREWSASLPSRFTPRERAPGTHWIGGWVGPRAVLDAVVKRTIPSLRRESNPRTPIVQRIVRNRKSRQKITEQIFSVQFLSFVSVLKCFCSLIFILYLFSLYEGVSKSIRTGLLEQELQMVQLSATRCTCIAIL
jgi:hypothetical protein